jgi:hypothetical protein
MTRHFIITAQKESYNSTRYLPLITAGTFPSQYQIRKLCDDYFMIDIKEVSESDFKDFFNE